MIICLLIIVFLVGSSLGYTFHCDTSIVKNDTFVTCTTISDGKIIEIDRMKNDKFHGLQQSWYKNGQLKRILNYNEGDLLDTTFSYYESGKLRSIGLDNGRWFTLSENGDTLSVGNKRNGKSIGTHNAWYENGNREFTITYNDSGKKDGLSVRWREDGTVQDSVIYRNGEMIEGWCYYDNGNLQYNLKKKGNDQYYSLVFYDPKGKKCGEVNNGNGTYIFYQSDGSSPAKVTKENGRSISIEEVDPVTMKVIDPTKTPEAIKKRIADSLGLKAMGAIKNDNVDSIKSLLKSGFDINTVFRDPEYFEADITMLHFAALLKKEKVARFLMENGADPNIQENQSRRIAAEVAFECRYDFDFVIIFLEGIEMPKYGNLLFGTTGFMTKVLTADSLKLFKYMVDKGYDPYLLTDEDLDVFYIAAMDGSVKCLEYLFTICDVPEYEFKDGYTIYHSAASSVNGEQVIKMLVKNGIPTSFLCMKNEYNGYTPYDYAVSCASDCRSYETQKREQYLKTAAYLKELQKKYCGIKDTNEKR
jgi:antitoxin component YwqK of YwqJK toxin-antitoxin module/ankyrin repeat protein